MRTDERGEKSIVLDIRWLEDQTLRCLNNGDCAGPTATTLTANCGLGPANLLGPAEVGLAYAENIDEAVSLALTSLQRLLSLPQQGVQRALEVSFYGSCR
jgi:hypothetical protein